MRKYRPEISSTKLGMVFGRDHATVLYGSRAIERKMAQDESFAAQVAELEAVIFETGKWP
jgi:chromosomal replication initiation ATPase DnaA